MANEQNLILFTPDNQPEGRGRPKGRKNRSTIVKQMLELKRAIPDNVWQVLQKSYPDLSKDMTVEEVMILQQMEKAILKQDTAAFNALMDSAYGKPTEYIEQEVTNKDVTIHIIENQADANPGEQNISA